MYRLAKLYCLNLISCFKCRQAMCNYMSHPETRDGDTGNQRKHYIKERFLPITFTCDAYKILWSLTHYQCNSPQTAFIN